MKGFKLIENFFLSLIFYFSSFFSDKSLKCKRKAFTEMLISQNDKPSEINKLNKLNPKKYRLMACSSKNNRSIAKTDKNKHNTPAICMYRIKVRRRLRFLISNKIMLFSFSLYTFFSPRMMLAMVKNRLVYAKRINEVAEKSRAGVPISKVIFN